MKYFIMILLLGCGNFFSHAQSAEQSGKWEIGLNILPLIDSSFYIVRSSTTGFHTIGAFPSQLMLRYQLNERWKLRANLGFTYSHQDGRPDDNPKRFLIHYGVLGGGLSLGGEYYVKTGRVGVYFGSSVGGYYLESVFKDEYDNRPFANPPTVYKVRDFYSILNIGLNGITGVNVRILPNFYLNIETTLLLAFRYSKNSIRRYEGPQLGIVFQGDSNRKRYLAELNPLSAIQIIYNF